MGTSEPLFEMKSPIKTELKEQVIDHHRGAFCEPCRGYKQRLNYKASRQYRHHILPIIVHVWSGSMHDVRP